MRPPVPARAATLVASLVAVLGPTGCAGADSGDVAAPSPSTLQPPEDQSVSRLEQSEVPFTESASPAPSYSDVPATLYAVLAERLDPRGEHLMDYDGSNDPASGVGAGKVPAGWSLNAEWRPKGLVGIVVAESWPDGWLCVDAYPGCREITVPDVAGVAGGDGATAQALATGRSGLSVGFETTGGQKVIVSAVDIAELSAGDLAAAAADERLDLP